MINCVSLIWNEMNEKKRQKNGSKYSNFFFFFFLLALSSFKSPPLPLFIGQKWHNKPQRNNQCSSTSTSSLHLICLDDLMVLWQTLQCIASDVSNKIYKSLQFFAIKGRDEDYLANSIHFWSMKALKPLPQTKIKQSFRKSYCLPDCSWSQHRTSMIQLACWPDALSLILSRHLVYGLSFSRPPLVGLHLEHCTEIIKWIIGCWNSSNQQAFRPASAWNDIFFHLHWHGPDGPPQLDR